MNYLQMTNKHFLNIFKFPCYNFIFSTNETRKNKLFGQKSFLSLLKQIIIIIMFPEFESVGKDSKINFRSSLDSQRIIHN